MWGVGLGLGGYSEVEEEGNSPYWTMKTLGSDF